jgi:glucokinase
MIGAVDVGGTKLLAAVAGTASGELEALVRRPTPAVDPLGALVTLLDEARGGQTLDAVCMAVPGPFDRRPARLRNPPNMPPAWHGLDLGRGLGEHFGCPVLVENDANCAALAEATRGAAAGLGTVVYITVSTGVGTGVVSGGHLLTGRHDTEGGHQVVWPPWLGGPPCRCGGAGCLETLVNGAAIERRFGRRPEDLTDPEAWSDVGRWLGIGVVNAIALHDPDAVILGGGICAAAARFWPSLVTTVEELLRLQPMPLVRLAALGEDRNLYGALALASGH